MSKGHFLRTLMKNDQLRLSFIKYFAGAAASALAAFAVYGLIAYNLYAFSLQEALMRYREQNLSKTGEFIDYVLESVQQDYRLISTHQDILELLTMPKEELPDRGPLRGRKVSDVINDLFKKTVLLPAIDSIYVYSPNNGCLITWTEYRTDRKSTRLNSSH